MMDDVRQQGTVPGRSALMEGTTSGSASGPCDRGIRITWCGDPPRWRDAPQDLGGRRIQKVRKRVGEVFE